MSFTIILGIFNFSGNILEIQVLMAASIFIKQIIMLNLFIALRDTFSKVKTSAEIANTKAMLDLLKEISLMKFWMREKDTYMFADLIRSCLRRS